MHRTGKKEKKKNWAEFPTDINEQSSISASDQRTAIPVKQKPLICHTDSEPVFLLVYSV